MGDRSTRIIAEILKVTAIVFCCFLWFDARLEESSTRVAHAATEGIDQARRATEARLALLEQEQCQTRDEIEAAHGSVLEVESDLRASTETSLQRERHALLETLEDHSKEMRSLIERGLTRIDGVAANATQEVHSRVDSLASRLDRQPNDMKRRMIYPVVQLRGNGTVGSGVVVRSDPPNREGISRTFILTAHHVVHEVMDPDAVRRDLVEDLRFLDPETDRLQLRSHRAVVLEEDPEHDLALLRVDLDAPWPFVAELASRKEVTLLDIFDPVYAVGCPLGNKPLPSVGEISSQEKMVSGTRFWMVNAPTFFGNSGGGIFDHGTGRLVGISSMIYTYGKRQPMVVPHMGLFVPLETVRAWLETEGYGHFFADATFDSRYTGFVESSATLSEPEEPPSAPFDSEEGLR